MNDTLELVRKLILEYLDDYLFKVEWRYGDCRAPFKYPPKIHEEAKPGGGIVYVCEIGDDTGTDEIFTITAESGDSLLESVRREISSRYGSLE
jgi:hypothetical protein